MVGMVMYIKLPHDTRHFLTSCRRDQFLKNPANASQVVSTVMGIFVSYIPSPPPPQHQNCMNLKDLCSKNV